MTTPRSRPNTLVVASVGIHLVCGMALVRRPTHWPVWLTVLLLDHAIVVGAGLAPRCRLLGPNLSQLPPADVSAGRVALTFDDGPDPEVTPQVLEILRQRRVPATFFCIGRRAAAHPAMVKAIAEGGHLIGNHSWSHSPAFWFSGPRKLARELDRTQELLESLAGQAPRYFRAPAGIRSPLLDPYLERRGLHLVSWTRRGFDTVTRSPSKVVDRLVDRLGAGDVLLLHDGSVARTRSGRPVVLEALPRLLDALDARELQPVLLP
ncbi:MAG: polysaccharide deacetylase family protein [Thermoanaerobaculia bacterium]